MISPSSSSSSSSSSNFIRQPMCLLLHFICKYILMFSCFFDMSDFSSLFIVMCRPCFSLSLLYTVKSSVYDIKFSVASRIFHVLSTLLYKCPARFKYVHMFLSICLDIHVYMYAIQIHILWCMHMSSTYVWCYLS